MTNEELKRRVLENDNIEGLSENEVAKAQRLIEEDEIEETQKFVADAQRDAEEQVEKNNKAAEEERQAEDERVKKERVAAQQQRDHFEALEEAGLEHVRQPNEGEENYGETPPLNVDETEHNDSKRKKYDQDVVEVTAYVD